jgi:serine/threonine protein phosphatase PrpC
LLRRVWAGAKSHASFVSQFKDEYPRLLVRRWRDAVLRDNSQRESVNDAVAASGTSEAQNQATLERYGTTIIVGLVTADFCMVGQIGDGDALLLQEKGPLTLIEPDASMYGTTTRSLCGPTPDRHWRVRRAPSDKSSVLMLSTDGLSDSFASRAGFLAFGTDLHHLLTQYGQRAIVRQIPVWLDGYSRDGSGDDITVGLASASSFSATPQFGESVP